MVNTSMLRARRGESTDEWYTTWPVVDRELSRHMDGLRGMRVYCNCDGPESMFAQWFAMHYTQLGLAGLRLSRVYVQCFLSRLGSVFPQFGLLVSRSVGAVWAGGAYEEGIGPPNLYIPGL